MKNGGEAKASKSAKKTSADKMKKAIPMVEVMVDESMPTEKEQRMLKQMKEEMDMDRNTNRGATQSRRLDYAEPFKDGGMVSKSRGNGIAIRGIRKCKMS
jgi:hypothetical protein